MNFNNLQIIKIHLILEFSEQNENINETIININFHPPGCKCLKIINWPKVYVLNKKFNKKTIERKIIQY